MSCSSSSSPSLISTTAAKETPSFDILEAGTFNNSFEFLLLEKFSNVTTIYRNTASMFLDFLPNKQLPVLKKKGHHEENSFRETIPTTKENGIWHYTFEENNELGPFQVLSTDTTPPTPMIQREEPVSVMEWESFYIPDNEAETNRDKVLLEDFQKIKQRVFKGGVVPSIRHQVWKYLLGIYPWTSTLEEREAIDSGNRIRHKELKQTWNKHLVALNKKKQTQDDNFTDLYHRIERDVIRTDRVNDFYRSHKNLMRLQNVLVTYSWSLGKAEEGYVQGMSDLASPFLVAVDNGGSDDGDESDAFWMFSEFMKIMSQNFEIDGSGMHRHLYTTQILLQNLLPALYQHFQKTDSLNMFVCFRWLIILFKREFSLEHTSRLWEVIWAFHNTSSVFEFQYFIAVSILEAQQDRIIKTCADFDETLKLINELSLKIDVDSTLERAEALYIKFKEKSKKELGSGTELLNLLHKIDYL